MIIVKISNKFSQKLFQLSRPRSFASRPTVHFWDNLSALGINLQFQPRPLTSDIPVAERGLLAKYRDFSVPRRSIIWLRLQLWQIIDLLASVKS